MSLGPNPTLNIQLLQINQSWPNEHKGIKDQLGAKKTENSPGLTSLSDWGRSIVARHGVIIMLARHAGLAWECRHGRVAALG